MTLCLHGNQDIDDMEDLANNMFKNVPNKDIKHRDYNSTPFKLCYGEGMLLKNHYEGVCP